MAKQIVWSQRVQEDRKQILKYWRQRNKPNIYSIKLNQQFKEAIKLIKDFPKIGKPTDDKTARIKIVRDYLLIYEETETAIIILTIWNGRQDPDRLEKLLKK